MTTMDIGFVLFPNVTQLDFTGPLQVLSRLPGAKVHIAASSTQPVTTDCPLALVPTTSFADCPALDMICVPGGQGVADAIGDGETVDFIRSQGTNARWITSVCTGAFLLGAAGLLKGKRATTHWGYTDLLPLVGATHEAGRVVQDGNTVTAGGVTSGIDFALQIVAEIAGTEVAQSIQLTIEYDPAPPFDSGHPSTAPGGVMATVGANFETANTRMRAALGAG